MLGKGSIQGSSAKGSVSSPADEAAAAAAAAAAEEEAAIRAQLGGPLKRQSANPDGTVTAQTRLGLVTYRPAPHVVVQRVQLSKRACHTPPRPPPPAAAMPPC